MRRLIKWFNLKMGLYHWYQCKYIYKDKNNKILFDFQIQKGVTDKSMILDTRQMKDINMYDQLKPGQKYLLCNGMVTIEYIAYLGYFKKR